MATNKKFQPSNIGKPARRQGSAPKNTSSQNTTKPKKPGQ